MQGRGGKKERGGNRHKGSCASSPFRSRKGEGKRGGKRERKEREREAAFCARFLLPLWGWRPNVGGEGGRGRKKKGKGKGKEVREKASLFYPRFQVFCAS